MIIRSQISTRLQQVIKIALLVFFIGHYSNVTMFYHAHNINGKLYFHSHFYLFYELAGHSESSDDSHSHTENQLNLIDLFNEITWSSDQYLPKVPPHIYLMAEVLGLPKDQPYYSSDLLDYSPRGPPVV